MIKGLSHFKYSVLVLVRSPSSGDGMSFFCAFVWFGFVVTRVSSLLADALQAGASQFEASAGKLKRKFWWKNCKV